MKIFLINPPYYFLSRLEYLSQNLGLGYLAAVLAKENHQVEVLDALAEGMERLERVKVINRWVMRIGLDYGEIVKRIPGDVEMIGITAPFSNHATIIDDLTAAIKASLPHIPIVVGGVYPSTQPLRALESSSDYIVVGEGESAMLALASGADAAGIPGVWFKKDGCIIEGGISMHIADLDEIPFPLRRLFPMQKYLNLSPRSRPNSPTATIITSRGCPFDCTFCSIHPVYGRKWRARSPENVLAEVDELIKDWGIAFIEFEDDNLTLEPVRARAIFEGLKERKIQWSCANGLRVDSLDKETLELMRDSGCQAIHLAIESGDEHMLRMMNKKLDLKKVNEVVKNSMELGLPIVPFIIVGHPGETSKSFKNTLRYVKRLKKMGMKACGVHIATPYPGTKLYNMCKENGWLINKDTDKRLMLPGDVHIQTEDFSRRDVMKRVYQVELAAGIVPSPSYDLNHFYRRKIKPALSRMGLIGRKYTCYLKREEIEGFHEPETWIDGVSFRWSKGTASILVKLPKGVRAIRLSMKSNRTHDVRIFLDETPLGEANLTEIFKEYNLPLPGIMPAGVMRLKFESDAVFYELNNIDAAEEHGFILHWFEFSG